MTRVSVLVVNAVAWVLMHLGELHAYEKLLVGVIASKDENIDEVRLKKAQEWEQSFRAWVGSDPERSARVEHAYNLAREFRLIGKLIQQAAVGVF